jgi:hypothetical protein
LITVRIRCDGCAAVDQFRFRPEGDVPPIKYSSTISIRDLAERERWDMIGSRLLAADGKWERPDGVDGQPPYDAIAWHAGE